MICIIDSYTLYARNMHNMRIDMHNNVHNMHIAFYDVINYANYYAHYYGSYI